MPRPATESRPPMQPTLRIAADIGGTFTDIALMLEDGAVATHKLPSTPDDYARAVVDGVCALMAALDLPLDRIGDVLHGCTVATNAILEGKGARTALVTTRGFRDVLEFRRIRVPRLYDPLYVKPEPLAPRNLRFEVTERVGPAGEIVTPLVESDLAPCIEALRRAQVEAVAVCFLHSYANPAHERRVGALLREALPGVFVTLSVDVLPEIREYERTSTTVINAYVGPVVARYIRALEAALRERGVRGRLLVMQSGGGILEAGRVVDIPARIVECGPAAGVIGAARQAALCDYPNVITLDMGGTTAKAAMIEAGALTRTDEYEVGGGISLSSRLVKGGGYALKLPVIDISEVGAGGGSVVWFDKGGALKVGPGSAGAVPGPACYAMGGTEATVTDANVVLGFINPEALAGGTLPIQAALSHQVIDAKAARPLGIPIAEAAWAIHVVASATMMRAVKAVSTYRGRDPSEFVLMAFGGNGGIFAVELARQLQMRRVLVPPGAGVFSAIGLGMADLEFGQSRAFLRRLAGLDPADINRVLRELEAEVVGTLGAPRDRVRVRRTAAMRYVGQAFELPTALPDRDLGAADIVALSAAFEDEHRRTYGHRITDSIGTEAVALEVIATAIEDAAPRAAPRLRVAASAPDRTSRAAYFGPALGSVETPVLRRQALGDQPMQGPLIIEEYEGTTVVPPDSTAWLDPQGNIVIEVGP
ncbi:MAG: hydantoinase/oxoprolinase family protein [Pseudomonadota bacterium]